MDHHPACFACQDVNGAGLGLRFSSLADGGVRAEFACPDRFQGYPDRLHGGIVAMLLDAAMTQCLFAAGVRGYTARMNVRYRGPVKIGTPAEIVARIVNQRKRLFTLHASVCQYGVEQAEADATFLADEA